MTLEIKVPTSGRARLEQLPFADRCSYCGQALVRATGTAIGSYTPPNARVWEHVEPRRSSELSVPPDIDVCVPACMTCNRSKGRRSLVYWLLVRAVPLVRCGCGKSHRCEAAA